MRPTSKSQQLAHSLASALASGPTINGSACSVLRVGLAGRHGAPLPVTSRYAPPSPMSVIGHGATRRCPRLLRQSPTSRTAARHVSWRCRGPNLVSWVRHRGLVRPRRKRSSSAKSRKPNRGKSRLEARATPSFKALVRATWAGQPLRPRGSSHLHRLLWLSSTVGLTTRCSGLASLAAELGIVRRFSCLARLLDVALLRLSGAVLVRAT